jgi:hypothetical protein
VPTKTKTKVVKHAKTVHRDLVLTSPVTVGPDVRALQTSLKKLLKTHKITWMNITIDAEYGYQTDHVCHFMAWVLGWSATNKGHTNKALQRMLRNPSSRNVVMQTRAEARKGKLERLRKAQSEGPEAAVKWALSQVGVTESPAGSNSNPANISKWEAYFGLGACFWCGVFAGYAVKKEGGAKVTGILTYGPDIIADANAHRNGLSAVACTNAKPGDLVVYWGGEHIGLIRAVSKNGMVITVEGNTSATNGSQSNGGCVALKERPFSDVTVVARPTY